MNRAWTLLALFGLSAAAISCAALAAEEKEEKIKFSEAPAAVQQTMKEEAGGAKIDMIEKEMEGGKWVYEAEVTIDGKPYEIEVAEDGTLLSKELDDDEGDEEDDDSEDDDAK